MATVSTKIGPADNGQRMSLNDFEYAEVQEGYLYELGRGVIVVSDVPKPKHLFVIMGIRDQLTSYHLAHPGKIHAIAGGNECKILLDQLQSERHPDVAVYMTPPPAEEDKVWSIWVPELVIEVVSLSSVVRDYQEKPEEYLAFGVKEYWIVDTEQRALHALQRHRGRWREVVTPATGKYETPLLPGFGLHLSPVFAEPPKGKRRPRR